MNETKVAISGRAQRESETGDLVFNVEESSPNAQGGYQYPEVVDHPSHYRTAAGIEAVDVIEAFELSWHLGNAAKYILRAGKKDGQPATQDIEKAIWYLRRWLQAQVLERG